MVANTTREKERQKRMTKAHQFTDFAWNDIPGDVNLDNWSNDELIEMFRTMLTHCSMRQNDENFIRNLFERMSEGAINELSDAQMKWVRDCYERYL